MVASQLSCPAQWMPYICMYLIRNKSVLFCKRVMFLDLVGLCPGTGGLGWDLNIFYIVINPGGDDDDAIVQLSLAFNSYPPTRMCILVTRE